MIVDLLAPTITGMWVDPYRYQMYCIRTHQTRTIFVPGAGHSDIVERAELNDIVEEYKEKFADEVRERTAFKPMTRATQHDMGRTLLEIRESKTHRKESLHGRYW